MSTDSIKEKSSHEKEGTQITVQALEAGHGETNMQPTLKMEEIKKPSLKDSLKAVCCVQTLMLAAPYACSFGGKHNWMAIPPDRNANLSDIGELALNSVLGPWYQQSLKWDQTKSGQVAAAFGLFNVISRPAGGVIADWLYAYVSPQRGTKTKQMWYGFVSRLDRNNMRRRSMLTFDSPVSLSQCKGSCSSGLALSTR
jgi:NNP family nitrate/nitrite transporter-like MFS transporter